MGEGERGRQAEDPFEDLERFFEPIQRLEWPDDDAPPVPGPGGDQDVTVIPEAEAQGAPAEPVPSAGSKGEPEAASEVTLDPRPTAELSVEEWRRLRDVLGDEEDEVQFEFPATPQVIGPEEGVFDLDRLGRDLVTTPEVRGRAAASAGMFGRPGAGLSASAGAGDEPPVPGPPPPAEPGRGEATPSEEEAGQGGDAVEEPGGAGGGTFSSSWPDPEDEEEPPGELTLEDLKKAPPEYRDLPGPRREQPVPPPSQAAPREHPVPPGSGPPAERPVPVTPGPAAPPQVGPGEPHVQILGGQRGQPEPSLAEVEAMADRLAREFREDEPGAEPPGPWTGEVWDPGEDTPSEPSGGAGPGGFDPFEDDLADFEPPEPAPEPTPPTRRTVKVGEPEDLTGPAWEDPLARTITREAPPPPRAGERNLPVAVLTAVGLIAAALISIWIKPVVFAGVAAVVILIALAEFFAAQHRHGLQPATVLGLVAGAMIVAGGYFRQDGGMLAMLVVATGATFLWYMATPVRARTDVIVGAAATVFGLVYVAFLAGYALVILSSTGSRALLLFILGLTFLYDISAFFVGRYWGRAGSLAKTISPKKSWEGLLGATVVTLLAAAVVPFQMGPVDSIGRNLEVGLLVVIFAPLGDLAESLLKRDLGIKDMGSILPGHGGMLDRIDSLLFVLPAVFYFLRVIAT